jgi:hypothetical protein
MADFDRFKPNGVRDPQESEMLPADDGQFVLYNEALTALQQQRKQVIAEVEEAPVELLRREADHATLWEKRHESVWLAFAGSEDDWPSLPAFGIYSAAVTYATVLRERARDLSHAADLLEQRPERAALATLKGGTDV